MKNNLTTPKTFYKLLLYSFFILISCKKDQDKDINLGPATLSVKLVGILTETDDNLANNSKAIKYTPPPVLEIPINNKLSAYVKIEEEKSANKKKKNSPISKYADTEVSPITPGVKYGIIVYYNGNLVENGHKIFTAGTEDDEEGFALDGGKTYTFIGYSRNSSLSIPSITNINTLNSAKIEDESEDLLYFKHELTLNTGENTLNVNLKHMFTLVTTEIKVGNEYGGIIQELNNGLFDKIREDATLELSNGNINYSDTETSTEIEFEEIPTEGAKSIQSTPNLLIAPESSNTVTYSFPSITINDTTAAISPISFTMQPGKKYNLILTFDVPCKMEEFYFNNYEQYEYEIDSMDASYYRLRNDIPLTINFVKVDNNFNIFYNDKPVFEARYETVTLTRTRTFTVNNSDTTFGTWTNWNESNALWSNWIPHDADFQSAGGNTSIRTMKFLDESAWGQGSIGEIYNLNGTIEIPVIRIIFSNQGSDIGMSITGNKNPGSVNALLPLVEIPHYSYSFSSLTIPPYPIYDSTPAIISNDNATNTQIQKITSIRKSMDFRMNTSFPKNTNGKDYIRVKQSTKSMFPQGGEGLTQLRGFFTPVLKGKCEIP